MTTPTGHDAVSRLELSASLVLAAVSLIDAADPTEHPRIALTRAAGYLQPLITDPPTTRGFTGSQRTDHWQRLTTHELIWLTVENIARAARITHPTGRNYFLIDAVDALTELTNRTQGDPE